jgi:hypothetical protein
MVSHIDTAASQLVFWARRFRGLRKAIENPHLNARGRLAILSDERAAAIKVLDILIAMTNEDLESLAFGSRDDSPSEDYDPEVGELANAKARLGDNPIEALRRIQQGAAL